MLKTLLNAKFYLVGLFVGLVAACAIAFAAINGWVTRQSQPMEAPEAEKILSAQIGLPFQVLIPAYLPGSFKRAAVEIDASQTAPNGQPMIQLTYSTRQGYQLSLSEWLEPMPADEGTNPTQCMCMCRSPEECQAQGPQMQGLQFRVGSIQVLLNMSATNLLTVEEVQFLVNTLGPALNRQVFTEIEDVPVTFSAPPAVEIPVNAQGVQEVILVVTPEGYSPAHFAVKKDIPVRLIFRQLGQVGCGNELLIAWGSGKNAVLTLASQNDKQVLEFTPEVAGVFNFNCPHLIYRGFMTVKE